MAVDSRGTRNQPYFNDANAFDLGADQGAISDYAALVGNRMDDTSSKRNNFSNSYNGASPWEGLRFYENDTGWEYLYTGGVWKPWNSPWVNYAPSIAGINGSQGATPGYVSTGRYRYLSGMVAFEWGLYLNGSGAAVNSNQGIWVYLPVPMDASWTDAASQDAGLPTGSIVMGRDVSAGLNYVLYPVVANVNNLQLNALSGPSGAVVPTNANTPFTWTTWDQAWGRFIYAV